MGGVAGLVDDSLQAALKDAIETVPDFPTPGIAFKDIGPLLADGEKFGAVIAGLRECLDRARITFDGVLAVESRGFIFGAPLASSLQRGLILVRKPGKLPGAVDAFGYSCEYATGTLEVRRGAIRPGGAYLVVDDLLATGGTARAVADHVTRSGGTVAGYCFVVELSFLGGRELLNDAPVVSLLTY